MYNRQNAITEKEVMMKSDSPFIVKLHYTFQDDYNLYFCLDYIPGGELFAYLQSYRRFPKEYVKFYAAEVLLALDHLHSEVKAIYRDLKPENVMLDYNGHVKLIDFGLSKSRKV